MNLAGLIKTSLLDYPGKISSVVFTQGCNFRCGYCHNCQLIPMKSPDSEPDILEEDFFEFLNQRKELLDGVVITGGEPTLQIDLEEFIWKIKSLGLLVKLDTNGTASRRVEHLLDQDLVDYIAMDVKMSWERYHELAPKSAYRQIQKTMDMVMKSGVEYEFRTTVVPGIHDPRELEEIAKSMQGAHHFYIQNFRPVNTYDSSLLDQHGFTDKQLRAFKNIAAPYVKYVGIRN